MKGRFTLLLLLKSSEICREGSSIKMHHSEIQEKRECISSSSLHYMKDIARSQDMEECGSHLRSDMGSQDRHALNILS